MRRMNKRVDAKKRTVNKRIIPGTGRTTVRVMPGQRLVINSKTGGKKMPRPKPKRKVTKKKKAKRKPVQPMFRIKGQSGKGVVEGSQYTIERKQDAFKIKKPPKKPKVTYV